ncbi:MAG: hypothetical protein ACLR23_01150 [Clostridia bacterium]
MLFYQGAKSYEIWTQRQFSEGELETMHEKFLAWARRHFHYGPVTSYWWVSWGVVSRRLEDG